MAVSERAKLNARIRIRARDLNLKLTDMPKAMGFSRSTWYAKRKGKVEWTISEMLKLAAIFQVSPLWLFPCMGERRDYDEVE